MIKQNKMRLTLIAKRTSSSQTVFVYCNRSNTINKQNIGRRKNSLDRKNILGTSYYSVYFLVSKNKKWILLTEQE